MSVETETLQGGCLCGALRYEFSGPIRFVSQCCCKDCQKATGTGHTTIVGITRPQITVTGEPKTFTVQGDSGGNVTRHFCGTCAGRLFSTMDMGGGDIVMVQSGSLDDPERVTPQNVIYYKDAISWDRFDPSLPIFEALPPRSA